jgi:hypothetical protein
MTYLVKPHTEKNEMSAYILLRDVMQSNWSLNILERGKDIGKVFRRGNRGGS